TSRFSYPVRPCSPVAVEADALEPGGGGLCEGLGALVVAVIPGPASEVEVDRRWCLAQPRRQVAGGSATASRVPGDLSWAIAPADPGGAALEVRRAASRHVPTRSPHRRQPNAR